MSRQNICSKTSYNNVKSYSLFQAINALQTLYLTHRLHAEIEKLLHFKVLLTPANMHSLILCMVHYLQVEDENLIEQRGILKNFIIFSKRMPEMPSNGFYHLFSFYAENKYTIELESLMAVLYKKKMLNDVIPSVLIRIPCEKAPKTFQKFKSLLMNLIKCPEELLLVYGHITLCVLDVLKKTALIYEFSESSNRLQTLTALKIFRTFRNNENL